MNLHDNTLFRQHGYVAGTWIEADNRAVSIITNPATGEALGQVPELGAVETRRAIEAAQAALSGWRALTAQARAVVLRRWFHLLLENQEDLATLMTLEQGKPLAEARGEIAYAASFLEWFAEEGRRVYGEVIPPHQADKRVLVLKEPVGVCAAITPWNFPAAMIARKAGAALAAGCTMVVKPAPQTPFSALVLAVLAERAGLPAGVLNIVTGPAQAISDEILDNPVVRKLSFTGSTRTGKYWSCKFSCDGEGWQREFSTSVESKYLILIKYFLFTCPPIVRITGKFTGGKILSLLHLPKEIYDLSLITARVKDDHDPVEDNIGLAVAT